MADLTSAQVWQVIEKRMFAVLGMVTARNEARTAGIVYIVHQRKLYIGSLESAWKTKHIAQNGAVSLTVNIPKRIIFLPWIPIPDATITFSGQAKVLDPADVPDAVIQPLFRGLDMSPENNPGYKIIEVTPTGHFVTYGVGVSLMQMRDTTLARGRVAVDG